MSDPDHPSTTSDAPDGDAPPGRAAKAVTAQRAEKAERPAKAPKPDRAAKRSGDDAPPVRAASKAEAKVLRAFLDEDGRLVRLPARRGKRLVVLDHLAAVFEPGVKYPETDVNALLRAFGDDVALLRRSLVDEGFLDRKGARYWRSGGSVDVDADSDRRADRSGDDRDEADDR